MTDKLAGKVPLSSPAAAPASASVLRKHFARGLRVLLGVQRVKGHGTFVRPHLDCPTPRHRTVGFAQPYADEILWKCMRDHE